ncbi:transposase [Dapis sp. BLCC M229]|uniref:transposase n=1 Tax=Dapis sp. BLCC M229 TaxID=3400188 RepID=UPI003CEE9927
MFYFLFLQNYNSSHKYATPKKLEAKLSWLQYLNRNKVKFSNNWKKAQLKIAQLYNRITDIRKDTLHKLTTYLALNHSQIVIEDLNVSAIMSNHKRALTALVYGRSLYPILALKSYPKFNFRTYSGEASCPIQFFRRCLLDISNKKKSNQLSYRNHQLFSPTSDLLLLFWRYLLFKPRICPRNPISLYVS